MLTREHKEATALLSIGTFLEYFDLMLYVHLAILLNNLFFPQTDPYTASLLSAFAFCSTYLLRPFGAIVFGYIGDHIGRKSVVIITTFLMAICCATLAALPTYANIGITSSIVVTICRMVMGLAANAESRGAEIYLTESIRPPFQYPLVAMLTTFTAIGTTAALGVGFIFTHQSMIQSTDEGSWRIAFLIGAMVALVGTVARTSLKEASEFADKKKLLAKRIGKNREIFQDNIDYEENVPTWTMVAYFFIHSARPPCFYFIYMYSADILKNNFGFSVNEVISQNFWVSIVDLGGILCLAYLSYFIYPLKILKWKLVLFFASMSMFPFMMAWYPSPKTLFAFQCLASLFVFDHVPATPIFFKHFPILKRFTYTSLLSAGSKLLTYFLTSFGLVIAHKNFGYAGIFWILIPTGIVFYLSVKHFERKERAIRVRPIQSRRAA